VLVRACNVVARSPAGQDGRTQAASNPTEPTTRMDARTPTAPNSLPTGSARVRATSPGPASCANRHTYIGQRHPHGTARPRRTTASSRTRATPTPPHSFLGPVLGSCSCSRFRSPPNHGSRRRQVEPRAVHDAPEAPARGRGVPFLPTRPPIAPLRRRRPRVGVGVLLLLPVLALGGDRSALVVGPGAAPPPRKPRAAAAAPGGDGERGGTGAGRGPPGGAAGEEGEEGQLLGAAAAAALPRWLAQERRRVLGGRRETERRGRGRRSVMLDQGATERPWRWTSASRCSVLCCSRVYAVSINLSVPWNGWPGIGETKGDLTARSFCKQTSNEACTCTWVLAPSRCCGCTMMISDRTYRSPVPGSLINYWPMQCKRVVNLFWQVVLDCWAFSKRKAQHNGCISRGTNFCFSLTKKDTRLLWQVTNILAQEPGVWCLRTIF
jgi:hypothetical protein